MKEAERQLAAEPAGRLRNEQTSGSKERAGVPEPVP